MHNSHRGVVSLPDWIIQNKEWMFSGIGVAIITLISGLLIKKNASKINQQKIKSGDGSINVQGGEKVEVSIGKDKHE